MWCGYRKMYCNFFISIASIILQYVTTTDGVIQILLYSHSPGVVALEGHERSRWIILSCFGIQRVLHRKGEIYGGSRFRTVRKKNSNANCHPIQLYWSMLRHSKWHQSKTFAPPPQEGGDVKHHYSVFRRTPNNHHHSFPKIIEEVGDVIDTAMCCTHFVLAGVDAIYVWQYKSASKVCVACTQK